MPTSSFPFRVVDLTQPLGPDTIMWPGASAPAVDVLASYSDGYYARMTHIFEHSGTHFDPPAHFHEGTPTTDLIPAEELVRPLAVIDIRDKVGDDPSRSLTVADLDEAIAKDGPIDPGSCVVLNTGWARFEREPKWVADADGNTCFPSFGAEAAQKLVDLGVAGLGADVAGIDSGDATTFPIHSGITLPNGVWHLEGLTNLNGLPARGGTIVAAVTKLVGGSGFPCRVLALLPE